MNIVNKYKDSSNERRLICSQCPKQKEGIVNTCSVCGCPILVRTSVPGAHCPDVPPKW